MKDKIKVLFVRSKKRKQRATAKSLEDLIELEAPDTYAFIDGYDREGIMEQVAVQKPEIVFLSQGKSLNALALLKEIKAIHPSAAVFVVLSNRIEDEQEAIDEYMAAGAYKCYFSTLVLDTLVHDMYVSQNLE